MLSFQFSPFPALILSFIPGFVPFTGRHHSIWLFLVHWIFQLHLWIAHVIGIKQRISQAIYAMNTWANYMRRRRRHGTIQKFQYTPVSYNVIQERFSDAMSILLDVALLSSSLASSLFYSLGLSISAALVVRVYSQQCRYNSFAFIIYKQILFCLYHRNSKCERLTP